MEEIAKWKKVYHFKVLGLSHPRDPTSLSANEVGIPGTLWISTEQKQGWQESKKSKMPPEHRPQSLHPYPFTEPWIHTVPDTLVGLPSQAKEELAFHFSAEETV